jgi:hypothetical protein
MSPRRGASRRGLGAEQAAAELTQEALRRRALRLDPSRVACCARAGSESCRVLRPGIRRRRRGDACRGMLRHGGRQGWQGRSRGADQRPAPLPWGARIWRPAPRAPRSGRSFLAPRAPRPSYGALVFGAPRPGRPGAPANPGGRLVEAFRLARFLRCRWCWFGEA